ncbi:MAG: sulfate reduction electron transfer complex DsrMKJOP subunit DsrP, partial [Desulfomonilaceae bacterium]
LVPWMWASTILAFVSLILLINPQTRNNPGTLVLGCAAVFFSLWIEKGITLVLTGYIPSPLETITQYHPTLPEICIVIGVWSLGFLILSILYKVALSVKLESAS